MPTPAPAPAENVLSRRTRFAVMASITLAALLASALFANIIGEHRSHRIDLTSTREHTLAPRTLRVLAQVDEPIEIVVSTNVQATDARSMQRVRDVLSQFERSSDQLTVTILDTGSTTALADFERVVDLLASTRLDEISAHRTGLMRASEGLRTLAGELPTLAEQLVILAQATSLADASNINTQALVIAEIATTCARAADEVDQALVHAIAGVNLPATDVALAAASEPFQNAIATAGAVEQYARELAARARDATNEEDRAVFTLADELADAAQGAHDAGATAFDVLARLGPLEPLQIARAMQVTPAVLIIGKRGTTAINLESLFPAFASPNDTAGRAQVRFVGEELVTTAISTLLLNTPPIVVIVHAERERLFDDVGRLVNPDAAGLASVIDRLRLRRMDVAEWAVALDSARPMLTDLNPTGARPVIWFVPGAPTRLNLDRAQGLAERGTRVGRLADAIATLTEARAPMLLAIEPSELPAAGQPDVLIAPLTEAFGVSIATGAPLIERIAMPGAVGFSAYHAPAPTGDSPIADALRNLPLVMQWPMRIAVLNEVEDVTVTPVLEVVDNDAVWGEAQWLAYRYANERQPLRPFAPRTAITQDAEQDDLRGPWTVAATIERRGSTATSEQTQRAVIVAAPSWYEPMYEHAVELEGRRVALYPGNRELMDASIWWLAQLDELIAPASTTLNTPRIAQLEPGRLTTLRWALIAGLPVLTLLMGIAVRVVRG